MHECVYLRAPAKVNLHLDILDKRADGFHNILSVFQLISLYDRICIRSLKETDNYYNLIGDFNFPVQENLITRAVNCFRAVTGISCGIEVTVEKAIPEGGGLGGGSSDAANVLAGLNLLFRTKIQDRKLKEMGMSLGSDVPFFMDNICAIVSGTGGNIKPVKPRKDFYFLLIYPGFGINTVRAYQWLDDQRIDTEELPPYFVGQDMKEKFFQIGKSKTNVLPGATEHQLEAIYRKCPVTEWNFYNSFRDILFQKYQEYNRIFRGLMDSGACYANISGSGSTMFGIFKEKKKAEWAFNLFKGKYSFIRIAKPLDKRPLFILK